MTEPWWQPPKRPIFWPGRLISGKRIAWFWILLRYPAGQLSAFTFLTPVFSVLFGALILSEPVTINLAAALVLVALGIYLVNRPRRA